MRWSLAVIALVVTTALALSGCGAGDGAANQASSAVTVEAVRTGRILPIEYNDTGHSPRAVKGLETLAKQLKDAG